jgi:hypothetical protein
LPDFDTFLMRRRSKFVLHSTGTPSIWPIWIKRATVHGIVLRKQVRTLVIAAGIGRNLRRTRREQLVHRGANALYLH